LKKNSKLAELAKFGEPYLDLGKEIAKSQRQKVFKFTREQRAVRIINLPIPRFPTSFAKVGTIRKIGKFDGFPGTLC